MPQKPPGAGAAVFPLAACLDRRWDACLGNHTCAAEQGLEAAVEGSQGQADASYCLGSRIRQMLCRGVSKAYTPVMVAVGWAPFHSLPAPANY